MAHRYGFEPLQEKEIGELNTHATLYRHETGAELLSLRNRDNNKVFGITFRTPPSDDTGVAHILEHSVLCGSRKYPLKEPFVELLKGSLQTFLNAMTYPDKTCYPVASQNLQDFYNLIDVYLDAVFYPRLTPSIFQQEGWHFELEDPGQPLSYKGVVFNEMKGAYSSPDNLLSEYSFQSLFPDTPYRFDSGGNPRHIPKLSFDQFRSFHHRYYHPSNARIFFYGDDPPDRRLELIQEYLKDFHPISVNSQVPLQDPVREPRSIVKPFPAAGGHPQDARGQITANWLLCEAREVTLNFALRMLEYILLGMPGSPLRKGLIESGLGEDIAGEGLSTEVRQLYFSAGLKGTRPPDSPRVESLIMETLRQLRSEGIHPLTVEAALNTIEFRFRENNAGHFPRGLLLMLRALTTWLYDGDPLTLLCFERPLEQIKSRVRSEKFFFEELIDRFFLQNTHRTTLVLEPDPDLGGRQEAEERSRLERVRTTMDEEALQQVVNRTKVLRKEQESPDPPEALATLPVLGLDDLEKTNQTIPLARDDALPTPVLFHDMATNGIAYLDLGFDLHVLPQTYLPYVPLFGRALLEMGTEAEDYVALTRRISAKTGGVRSRSVTSAVQGSDQSMAWLYLRGKATLERTEDLMEILQDLVRFPRLDNPGRFRQMVLEEKARIEHRVVPAGHQVVALRVRSHLGEAHWAAEQMGGISYLMFLRELAEAVVSRWEQVLETLREMHRLLINGNTMLANVTVDQSGYARTETALRGLLRELPLAPPAPRIWEPSLPSSSEGLTVPSQVNYVGKGANLYDLGYRFHGSSLVITRYLRNAWLWDRVRVQGGAYGAFCMLDRISGALTFVSYRDPNHLETLKAYDGAAQFLMDAPLSRDEMIKSIIGTIGDLDNYLLPDAKGYVSMLRYLTGDTDELRQQMREEILGARKEDFRSFAAVLEQVKDHGLVKILGPPATLAGLGDRYPGWLTTTKVL